MFLAFAIAFLNAFSIGLDVDAAEYPESIQSFDLGTATWSYDVNKTYIPTDTNMMKPIDMVVDEDIGTPDTLDIEWYFWYQFYGYKSIVTTDKEYFAYKIVVQPCDSYSHSSDALWDKVTFGTLDDLVKGNGAIGTNLAKGMNPSLWYVTDHAEKNLYLAVTSYFKTLYMKGMTGKTVDSSLSTKVKIYAYKEADYVRAILDEVNSIDNRLVNTNGHLSNINNSLQVITDRIAQQANYSGQSYDELKSINQALFALGNSIGDLNQAMIGSNYTQKDMEDDIENGNTLQQQSNNLQTQANKLQEESNNTQKNFFTSFFDNITETILGIFIPSNEEMGGLFGQLNDFFSETFGFLYYPFELIVKFIETLSGDGATTLTLPGFEIMGHTVWEPMSIDLSENSIVTDVFGYVRIGTSILLSMAFISYLRAFFDKRFGGGG